MTEPKHERAESRTQDDSGSASLDERACAERIRAGDRAAFEVLYRAYWQPLYVFAFRYMQSKEEAEEVVQEVFFRIWRGREDWRLTGSVRTYLYVAVRNVAQDRLKHATVARRWRDRRVHELRDITAPATHEIEAQLQSAELAATIEHALAELPARRRAVCTLRLIDGLSYAQIAERLGITAKTVENQIGQGLKFLRERLRDRMP